ncbi:hypothetical protein EXS62_01950 [Candidatus Kaiserbacteria bacterium]|nr:hypothetical protein [Candidatus Kaiserbacteria bacterium]
MKKLIGLVAGFLILAVALPVFAQTSYPTMMPIYAVQCPQLWSNLVRGSSDYTTQGQVTQLQQFLSTRYYQPVTGYFGAMTWANVARFQREQGLWPITGGVGPLTRAAIARLCAPTPIPPYPTYNAPSITSVSGPTQLTVGQSGTWSVSVTDASQYLSYSVVWGDEQPYPYPMPAAAPQAVSSSGTLSHTYTQAGTYTPRFTVTNGYGQSATGSATVVVSGAPTPPTGTFYLGTAFNLAVGQTVLQYQGQISVRLNGVAIPGYIVSYPYPQSPLSASVTLGQSCPPGLYCAAFYYPEQTVSLVVGQSTTFQGRTVTLTGLTESVATLMVQ